MNRKDVNLSYKEAKSYIILAKAIKEAFERVPRTFKCSLRYSAMLQSYVGETRVETLIFQLGENQHVRR